MYILLGVFCERALWRQPQGQYVVENEFILNVPLNFAIVPICTAYPLVSELAQAKYVTLVFNSKWNYEELATIICILQNMQNLVISHYYAENG